MSASKKVPKSGEASPGKSAGKKEKGGKKEGGAPAKSAKRAKAEEEQAQVAMVKSSMKKTAEVPGQRKAPEKKAKSNKRQNQQEKRGNNKEKKKPKQQGKKNRTLYETIGLYFGYYMGPIKITDPYALEAVSALNLSMRDLRKLKAKFDSIDLDGSGAIDYDEFFEAVGEVRSPFTDKLFQLIDLDGSGTIEFDEYVRVMATYCMFTKDEVLRFCFECFDVDKSGTIDEKEFVELCRYEPKKRSCVSVGYAYDECVCRSGGVTRPSLVTNLPFHLYHHHDRRRRRVRSPHFCCSCSVVVDDVDVVVFNVIGGVLSDRCINNASPAFPNNFKRALEEFDVNEDGLIDYSEFQAIDVRYPLILFPAFRLQDVMQRASLGENQWLTVIENYEYNKGVEEYKATHGGRAPPDPPLKAFLKMIAPCFFREKVHIVLGKELEDRQQADQKQKK